MHEGPDLSTTPPVPAQRVPAHDTVQPESSDAARSESSDTVQPLCLTMRPIMMLARSVGCAVARPPRYAARGSVAERYFGKCKPPHNVPRSTAEMAATARCAQLHAAGSPAAGAPSSPRSL